MTWSEDTRRLRLWRKGLTDSEIGAVLGISRQAFGAWRRRRGLGQNIVKEYVADDDSIFKDDDFLQNFFKGDVQLKKREKKNLEEKHEL